MVTSAKLHWICSVPIGITVSILGLIGNISIYVWKRVIDSKLRQNQSTGIYLIALGIFDSGLLFFFLLTDSLPTQFPKVKETYSFAAFFSWIAFPLFFMFLVASIWLVVGVTINRFIMIRFPLKVRTFYSNARTYAGIAVIVAWSVLLNIPHFFNYYPKQLPGEEYVLATTNYGNSIGSIRYEFWVHCIFLVLTPWFSIAVLNGFIVYKIMKQSGKFFSSEKKEGSKKFHKQERREQQMTRTLLAITFAFLVLLAWQCITQCFWMLGYGKNEPHQGTWEMVDGAFALAKLGVIINSSINCIFYCFTGSMFKKELRKLFNRGGETSVKSSSSSSSQKNSKSTIIKNSEVSQL